MKKSRILFILSAVLWLIWGLVHILAGVMTMKGVMSGDIASSISGIADAIDPKSVQMDYPKAAGAIIGQHGFNLLWIGIVTAVCSYYILKENRHALILAAITGGLADLGYYFFLDLGGFVNFIPGTLMTVFSASAILSGYFASYLKRKSS